MRGKARANLDVLRSSRLSPGRWGQLRPPCDLSCDFIRSEISEILKEIFAVNMFLIVPRTIDISRPPAISSRLATASDKKWMAKRSLTSSLSNYMDNLKDYWPKLRSIRGQRH